MLCSRCGEREASEVIYVEAGPLDRPSRSSPEERRAREEELSRLCERCLLDVTVPREHRAHIQHFFDEQERMHATATAHPASETLRSPLDALEAEAIRVPPDVVLVRQRLEELLQYLASPEGRTLANFDATKQRLTWASDWAHLPALEREILLALSGPTMEAVWQPDLSGASDVLPEQLLARLHTES
jgi:hypothetical protein